MEGCQDAGAKLNQDWNASLQDFHKGRAAVLLRIDPHKCYFVCALEPD